MQRDFTRLAIVNRGEAAMRCIHAVRELNRENGVEIRTIALFTEPDREAMFVREADEAVCLGPAMFVDTRDGQRKSGYFDYARLEQALRETRADAAWVGWGLVAEQPEFADLCDRLGLVFVGPTADSMRRLGDKITSKRLAEAANVPVAPWSGGPVESLDDARAHAERLGYPLMIKATAGGGGRGIRRVDAPGQLESAFESARTEALRGFGDATVFMEKLVTGARHIEVQIVADGHGATWALGVRDCSVQRRNQKVVEESSSVALTPEQNRHLCDASIRLANAAGYRNAGTVEFLYDAIHNTFSFMEVNARLQVEHPVTEATTGADVVKLQLHVARGGRLEGEPPPPAGHAIEARLCAEDPANDFAPAPGRVELVRLATGPGIRIDTGVEAGDRIAPEYDSMIAKIIAFGRDRHEALARLRRAVSETVVVVDGGTTNKSFLLKLLERPELLSGDVTVGWLDELAATGDHTPKRYAEVAIVQAAIAAYDMEFEIERESFYRSAARLRPVVRREIGRTVELLHRGNSYAVHVRKLDGRNYRVEVDGRVADVAVDRISRFEQRLTYAGRAWRVVAVVKGFDHTVEVDGISHRVSRGERGVVRAPAPAVIVSYAVKPGDDVRAGDSLLVLEAMKMEVRITAPFAGRIQRLFAMANVQVNTGDALVQIEPAEEVGAEVDTAPRVAFELLGRAIACVEDPVAHRLGNLEELRRLLLGFDVDPADARRLVAELAHPPAMPEDRVDELVEAEDHLLETFVDIGSVFPRQPALDDPATAELLRAEQLLLEFLRGFDETDRALPRGFVERLRRAVAHYGVTSLERSPRLEEAMVWLFKAHARADQQFAPVASLLSQRLEHTADLAPKAGVRFRTLLDRLIAVTQFSVPTINDLAREVRYVYFDRPQYEAVRTATYQATEQALARLEANPDADTRMRDIETLVACPQPLFTMLVHRFDGFAPRMRQTALEALVRRYYRIRPLERLDTAQVNGFSYVHSEYEHQGRHIHVIATYACGDTFARAAEAISPMLKTFPEDHDVVLDFYVCRLESTEDPSAMAGRLAAALDAAGFVRPVRRIVVGIAGEGTGIGSDGAEYFTFRCADDGSYREETLYRNLHPMMGKRLHLWRFANFDMERLPSAEDVYLFRAVAKDNPKDERLFAVAEVRALTPQTNAEGRITGLPHLERMLLEALGGIRLNQAQRRPADRLHFNRVLLYVWPTLDLSEAAMTEIARKLAPATEGVGLDEVVVRCRMPDRETGDLRDTVIRITRPGGKDVTLSFGEPTDEPISSLSAYDQKVVRLRRIGLTYPYEIVRMLTPSKGTLSEFPVGTFLEHDLDAEGHLVPVDRPYGLNKANIIVGLIHNYTERYPEGMTRVLLLGDPSREMGSLAEAECRRIMYAIDMADRMKVPLEWFPVSAGAKISMESGTENMDWIARVLRRLIEFTQGGGEVNLLVNGINVGAQPYWNAEATMLMHTRGILVMTPEGAMVLTGKRALDYSGSVSADDNFGIGGYDRVMGPNGQAQYWARDIAEAAHILLRHYDHTYVAPGERFPRRAKTSDPSDRDVCAFPHPGPDFSRVGEVFSNETNLGRKKPFDIRSIMRAAADQDHEPLERWEDWRDAENAVVWDAHVGGYPVCMLGFESHPVARLGFVPADGPEAWTSGTLFPQASRKIARAINAASGNRPLVVLANLSGFDGSPESMRKWQLEYGAEIGRAVTNFKGPIAFVVVSRYHGGAFVVFSRTLNENMEVVALDGTYASVIGGAPAAAVVFSREVDVRMKNDDRVKTIEAEIAATADEATRRRLRAQLAETKESVHSEKLGQVAEEFDKVHSVERALRVGSLDGIIPPATLRPFLIDAIERGMARTGANEKAEGAH